MIGKLLLYIDPGSGSYLIQVIIAAVLGAAFFFKNLWWKFRSLFTRKKPPSQQNDNKNV
ncbi:MAG TPA: hypothetical protein VHC96_07585 [Puia sp.]|jgi:hypothetical protein|nr:hypothetical protein [Puia sp.]